MKCIQMKERSVLSSPELEAQVRCSDCMLSAGYVDASYFGANAIHSYAYMLLLCNWNAGLADVDASLCFLK